MEKILKHLKSVELLKPLERERETERQRHTDRKTKRERERVCVCVCVDDDWLKWFVHPCRVILFPEDREKSSFYIFACLLEV